MGWQPLGGTRTSGSAARNGHFLESCSQGPSWAEICDISLLKLREDPRAQPGSPSTDSSEDEPLTCSSSCPQEVRSQTGEPKLTGNGQRDSFSAVS